MLQRPRPKQKANKLKVYLSPNRKEKDWRCRSLEDEIQQEVLRPALWEVMGRFVPAQATIRVGR